MTGNAYSVAAMSCNFKAETFCPQKVTCPDSCVALLERSLGFHKNSIKRSISQYDFVQQINYLLLDCNVVFIITDEFISGKQKIVCLTKRFGVVI